jgi:hypothetical protein
VGATAVAGAAPAASGFVPAAAAVVAPAVAGRALSGVVRGTGRTACAAAAGCCARAAASALTRCSRSAARSGARPAHSRRRLISRAWENTSSESTAMPSSAANATIAPTSVNAFESESESASGVAIMNPESV